MYFIWKFCNLQTFILHHGFFVCNIFLVFLLYASQSYHVLWKLFICLLIDLRGFKLFYHFTIYSFSLDKLFMCLARRLCLSFSLSPCIYIYKVRYFSIKFWVYCEGRKKTLTIQILVGFQLLARHVSYRSQAIM